MLTNTDTIKTLLLAKEKEITEAEAIRERKRKSLELLEGHIDGLHVQHATLEAQLQREQAQLVQGKGKCVTVESNGVLWKV